MAKRETVRKLVPVAMLTKQARCGCTHHNALTCQSEQYHTTRFNAMLCYGNCLCTCHTNKDGSAVSADVWNRRHNQKAS